MATQLQIRRGTNSQVAAFTGAEGEIVVNTTNDSIVVSDGSTAGGFEMARADLNNVSDTDLNAALTGNTVSALTITTLTLGATAITATGTELNLLDGVTATTAELNYVDGVTSAIQTQIDTKAPLASPTFTGTVTATGLTVDGTTTTNINGSNYTFSGTNYDVHLLVGSSAGGVRLGQDSSTNSSVIGTTGTNDLEFVTYNGSAWGNRMTLTNTGNVKIGTATDRFSDLTASTANLQIDGGVVFEPGSGNNVEIFNYRTTDMLFGNGATEAMRISGGNLLVGKTTTGVATAGTFIGGGSNVGLVEITRDNNRPLRINRTSSDGQIVRFDKDGTNIGSIVSVSGTDIMIGTSDTGLRFVDSVDAIAPCSTNGNQRDNAIDLGRSAFRFDDIYATNGTIQTSDRNEKQDIEALSDAEQRVAVAAKGLLRKFRWISSVQENGDDARIHFGIIAQDLQDAFTAEGLDAGRYAMFISSTWTDDDGNEQTRLGVRYSELLAFIISAI